MSRSTLPLTEIAYRSYDDFNVPEVVCDRCNALITTPVVAVAHDMAYCGQCLMKAVGEPQIAAAFFDLPVTCIIPCGQGPSFDLFNFSMRMSREVNPSSMMRFMAAIQKAGWVSVRLCLGPLIEMTFARVKSK